MYGQKNIKSEFKLSQCHFFTP